MEDALNTKLDELRLIQQQMIILLEKIYGKIEPSDEWIDNNDICRLLKISERTLYRWRKTGILQGIVMGGKSYYSRKQVLELKK